MFSKHGQRQVAVGRIKKEKRKMKRIELENNISATLQDVETLNLLNEKPLRLIDCKINDRVLAKKEICLQLIEVKELKNI